MFSLKKFLKKEEVEVAPVVEQAQLADGQGPVENKGKKGKRLKGFSLTEILVGIAVAALLAVVSFSVAGPAFAKARSHRTREDCSNYITAIQNVTINSSNICRYTPTNPTNAAQQIVDLLNSELSADNQITYLGTGSGLIGYTPRCLDPYKNPYGVYVYFSDKGTTYRKNDTENFGPSDSVLTIVIMSAGANATGGPTGYNGANVNNASKAVISASDAINNTDGVDDQGIIVQIVNGELTSQYFGFDGVGIGSLKGKQWILGVPDSAGGITYDYVNATATTATGAGSIQKYYNEEIVKSVTATVIGAW